MVSRFGAMNQVFFAIGLIFTFALSFILSLFWTSSTYWRIIYIIPAVIMPVHIYYLKLFYPF